MKNEISFRDKDVLVMKMLHYFITEEGYNPIILRGVSDEIWLENMDAPYKIVRINTGYIHNDEQMDFDMFKTKKIMGKIKLKTLTWQLNTLSLFVDLGDSVEIKSTNNISCVSVKNTDDIANSKLVYDFFPNIKEKLKFNEEGIELFTKITEDINRKNIKDAKEAEDVFKEKVPYVTYILIAINVIMFIITNLLNRFYDINDGEIYYDGIPIKNIKKKDLRKSLGMVLQDVNLFTGSVMDNVKYGKTDASNDDVIKACKLANAHDFIMRLPDGYDTILDGSGENLSQGQKQLISIARALINDPPVMILDEATSNIDTRTEKIVASGMDKLMDGRTVLVIAHRLSTIQNAKAIMVMSHGRIIERGEHDYLISQKGEYYQLYTGALELE